MHSLDVRLAWVVSVDPVLLATNLSTFLKLKPTVETLRLCNRFGTGDGAHIARLPIELVERIESFLVEQERAEARKEHDLAYKCFTDTCSILDHYEEMHQAYAHAYQQDPTTMERYALYDKWDCDCPKADQSILSAPLSKAEKNSLEEYLRYNSIEGHCGKEHLYGWQEDHYSGRDLWNQLTGESYCNARGAYSRDERLLKRVFGLEFDFYHDQTPTHPWDQGDQKAVSSTKAYFILGAGPSSRSEWLNSYYRRDDTMTEQEFREGFGPNVEASHVFSIGTPSVPSATSLRRFARAMKMLGLSSEDCEEVEHDADLTFRPKKSSKAKTEEAEEKAPTEEASEMCQPVLRLLTRSINNGNLVG